MVAKARYLPQDTYDINKVSGAPVEMPAHWLSTLLRRGR